MSADDRLGPAFDTNTLIRPTQRRLVGCWMETADLPTLIVPQVWRELTFREPGSSGFTAACAWERIRQLRNAPYEWPTLTADEESTARELRRSFTEACFPNVTADRIATHTDAIIVSEAIALGTDALVTGDVRSIDHYEVNAVIRTRLGRNSSFVVTLDNALMQAHSGGELGEVLLTTALATVAPSAEEADWPVDDAHERLLNLRRALLGANMPATAERLLTRWEQSRELQAVLQDAITLSRTSPTMRLERTRTEWHRSGRSTAGS